MDYLRLTVDLVHWRAFVLVLRIYTTRLGYANVSNANLEVCVGEKTSQAKDILERILSSYGFNSRQQYSEVVGVPLGTIGNWVSRDSIPGDYVIRCVLDTGEDLSWILTGELKKSSPQAVDPSLPKGRELYEKVMSNGGKPVVTRMLSAYGFSMQKELGDLLGISSGTMSAWVRREYFPGDVVVTCALETGASLRWLATGEGDRYTSNSDSPHQIDNDEFDMVRIKKKKLMDGLLIDSGHTLIDKDTFGFITPDDICVTDNYATYYVDFSNTTLSDGIRLIDIDGYKSFYSVIRKPGNRLILRSSNNPNIPDIECEASSVKSVGSIKHTLIHNVR